MRNLQRYVGKGQLRNMQRYYTSKWSTLRGFPRTKCQIENQLDPCAVTCVSQSTVTSWIILIVTQPHVNPALSSYYKQMVNLLILGKITVLRGVKLETHWLHLQELDNVSELVKTTRLLDDAHAWFFVTSGVPISSRFRRCLAFSWKRKTNVLHNKSVANGVSGDLNLLEVFFFRQE